MAAELMYMRVMDYLKPMIFLVPVSDKRMLPAYDLPWLDLRNVSRQVMKEVGFMISLVESYAPEQEPIPC